MRNIFDQESQSYDPSGDSEESSLGRNGANRGIQKMQKLISLNVTIFNDLGFSVCADNFRSGARYDDDEDIQPGESESQRSQIDYGDSQEEDSSPAVVEMNINEEEDIREIQPESRPNYRQQFMIDQLSFEESNNQSPFFPQILRQEEGMSAEQINSLPSMHWSRAHNIFNRGQICTVCMQEFQLGNILRVMQCLHRYHIECLDQWLTLKASCPSCRNPPNRQAA